jgi:hypothetical protein
LKLTLIGCEADDKTVDVIEQYLGRFGRILSVRLEFRIAGSAPVGLDAAWSATVTVRRGETFVISHAGSEAGAALHVLLHRIARRIKRKIQLQHLSNFNLN